ncbi:uncharacterized protein PGTG_20007 [Puccinia graminis f. sp. tritici CRL 75-36-700-3]|uniref:CCHC-type domain-containing protein n=1 Tax=Puccinia graminis f. sp. tritici (strain CRL 75-36-700-3 / race SCCL) TaxID=418459 RepID=E3LBR6_PUCGT|nr:uncharacterized protein PGTG_20007 [Puccinia graminis f. sp. tritici CRL 75-36-700-3]EFP93991.1 hypothetical protein PGTG_20007 [Puccinia graminis f. sp. tritici CRL 75-36-700-3]
MESESRLESSRYLLTSDNYSTWIVSIEAKLEDIGARELVTGLIKIDEKTTPDELDKYTVLNKKGYLKIIQNLDATNLALVSTTLPEEDRFKGRALWKLLKNKYAGSDLVARSTALDHFLDLEYTDVGSFCSAIRLANQRLVLANVLKDDQVKIMIMLRKLPREQYQSFRDIIAMGFASETFESAVKRLESYAISNNIKKGSFASSSDQATMMTKATTSKSTACSHCGKTGHRPHNCWTKYPEKAAKTESAHLTLVDGYNQLQGVTNWCTLPDGTRMNADDISYDCLRGM